ncbi:hypothetical protein SAY86_024301 [Trapa natans]|uniref:Protein POLYCHOME n=1 Tax=Trapa natans TaxID=22666 RepID=A0AAN7MPP5_TRANT|nr:hypothetical protein SAY86_024301 [Trapa natans]
MPESRDRLVRPVDVAAAFSRRRSGILGVLSDERDGGPFPFEPPIQQRSPGIALGRGTARGRGGGLGRGALGTPRVGIARSRNLYRSPLAGGENTPITGSAGRWRGRGRPVNSLLPSWYPRSPFRDITSVMRALERRRSRFGEIEGREIDSPLPSGPRTLSSSLQLQGAHLEHKALSLTPSSSTRKMEFCPPVGKVPKILLNITNKPIENDSTESLTPQKKLLNQIDTVEKEVLDELRKLKRTPSAKKAERDKRIRTLQLMR